MPPDNPDRLRGWQRRIRPHGLRCVETTGRIVFARIGEVISQHGSPSLFPRVPTRLRTVPHGSMDQCSAVRRTGPRGGAEEPLKFSSRLAPTGSRRD